MEKMMYKLEGMGIRIQARRKELGLTQGEFAERLNISPQAVSKWETGLGMPDISSLPDIASILDMSIDELFGRNVPREDQTSRQFPENLEGDRFITVYGDQVLYADPALEIQSLGEDLVRFADGSEVDLTTRVIYNRGKHSLRLVDVNFLKELPEKEEKVSSAFDADQEVKNLRLDLGLNRYDLELLPTEGPVYWETNVVEGLEIQLKGEELVLRVDTPPRRNSFFNFGLHPKEKVTIYLPRKMEKLIYRSSGAGDLDVAVDFEEAHVTILGAGDINFNEVGNLILDIKGAGDVRVRKVGSMEADLAGAGDIDVEEIQGNFTTRLKGAGDIHLGSGSVDLFKLTISGAGDVDASRITAKELEAGIHGPGSLTLGRLLGSSKESVSFMGSLKILQRGE